MKKQLAVIGLLAVVLLVAGCTGGDSNGNNTITGGGELTLAADLGQASIPSSGATTLTININNGWNSNLERVRILLQGGIEGPNGGSNFAIDDETALTLPGRESGDIFTGEQRPEIFTITAPMTSYDKSTNIVPKICFINVQYFDRDVVLSTDSSQTGPQPTEESQSDGPLRLNTQSQINPILALQSRQISLSFQIINDLKDKYENAEIDSLDDVTVSFTEKSNFELTDITLQGEKRECNTQNECSVSFSDRKMDTLSLILRANIDDSIEGISHNIINIRVTGQYCVSLPSMKITAEGIPGSQQE